MSEGKQDQHLGPSQTLVSGLSGETEEGGEAVVREGERERLTQWSDLPLKLATVYDCS